MVKLHNRKSEFKGNTHKTINLSEINSCSEGSSYYLISNCLNRLLIISSLLFITASAMAQAGAEEVQQSPALAHGHKYHVEYPQEALEARITGTIHLTFDIDSACNFVNVQADTVLHFGCDEYAIDCLRLLEKETKMEKRSKCEPAFNQSLPVEFKIE